MTISPRAINDFLSQKRDNHLFIKSLSTKQIDGEIERLNPKPKFWPNLRIHQKICFLLGLAYPQFFFQLDMGTGKSLLSLVLLSYFHQLGHKKFLIQVPMDESIDNWIEQTTEWGFDLPVIPLRHSGERKLQDWDNLKEGVAISTYIGLATSLSRLQDKKPTKNKKKVKGREWKPDLRLVEWFRSTLDGVVFDESTKICHQTSLSFEIAQLVSRNCLIRYALAGRPFGKDPQDLWAQFYLIDRGETLGSTLTLFRETFFLKTRSRFGGPFSFTYKLNPKKNKTLTTICQHRSIAYAADECIELPDLVKIRKKTGLTSNSREYYDKYIQDIIDAKGNLSAVKNAFIQMRQISSGFIGFRDDDTDEKVEIEFDKNPKFDMLMDLVAEVPENEKAIIFHDFTFSGRKIHNALTKEGYKNGWLWGGTKDWKDIKYKFDNDSRFRFLVIQSKKGSYSLNLQRSNIAFFYESPVPAIDRDQAERRIYRQGQTRKVRIYDLITKNTVDELILAYHKQGGDLFKDLISNPAKMIGKR
ncbi:MAG TPA: DEAD/DEAH box helicase [Candidatus Nitrosotalea sp.]|nr:DEAD/DEAH box helicase [Candidatus Nitrosotalea sp.]